MRTHIFPFDKIDRGAKIVLWGLGVVGKEYVDQVMSLNYCEIQYIIDNSPQYSEYKGIAVYHPNNINQPIDNSVLYIISVFDKVTAENIRLQMVQKGISKNRIINSITICNFMNIDCEEDIIDSAEDFTEEKIDMLQKVLLKKDCYIGGIPFFIKNADKKQEYLDNKRMFCETNRIINNLDQTRVFFLWQNVENILAQIKGDVAEVGVYQGATAVILKQYCIKYLRKLFLFDTFEGFDPADRIGIDEEKHDGFRDTSLEYVKKRLGDGENIFIMKGHFPDSVDDEVKETSYAFVHIDCDLYKPILEGLKFFWPRLTKGGMIAVHDYSSGFWDGATKAVDEFCDNNNIVKLLIPDWSGTVALVKSL